MDPLAPLCLLLLLFLVGVELSLFEHPAVGDLAEEVRDVIGDYGVLEVVLVDGEEALVVVLDHVLDLLLLQRTQVHVVLIEVHLRLEITARGRKSDFKVHISY